VDSIQRFAPSLTHLGVPTEAADIALGIRKLAVAMLRSEMQDRDGMVFPGTLENLVIEGDMGYPGSGIVARCSQFKWVLIRVRKCRMPLYEPGDIWLHWKARMDGKDGYWTVGSMEGDDAFEWMEVESLMTAIRFGP